MIQACLSRSAALLLSALVCGAAPAAQTQEFALTTGGVVSRVVFDFGLARPWIDSYSPPQTGFVSSPALNNNTGVQALLTANPTATASFSYDAAGLAALNDNGVLYNYLQGGSLTATLPAVGPGPLTLSNTSSGFHLASLADGARVEPSGDLLFLPGAADVAFVGMAGAYQGSGLTLANGSGTVTKVNLRADPFFVATYNGSVPLPSLSSLIVNLTQPTTLTLNTVSLLFLDSTGSALTGTTPPAQLPVQAFAERGLSMSFQGTLQLSLQPGDYANTADYNAAVSWLAASGFRGVSFSQSAYWLATPVSEPPAAVLLLAGLAVMTMLRARRSAAPESRWPPRGPGRQAFL